MKKNLFLLFLLILVRLFAISENLQEKSKELCCEKQKNAYAFYYPKDPNLFCLKNFNISAAFLYMIAYEDSLSYAVQIN